MAERLSHNEIAVYLNVYDLQPTLNSSLYPIGLGLYHTGIQLEHKYYAFYGHSDSSTGVQEVPPKVNHPNFRYTILLGKTTFSYRKIYSILDSLKDKFTGDSYHVIRKNCNTFSNCFCEALLNNSIPAYVNRMARIGKTLLEIDDFLRMRPYYPKYETSTTALGVPIFEHKNVFAYGKGVIIG